MVAVGTATSLAVEMGAAIEADMMIVVAEGMVVVGVVVAVDVSDRVVLR